MKQHYVLVVTEYVTTLAGTDEERTSVSEYLVSTRKLDDWRIKFDFEYNYVEHIITACLAGKNSIYSSHKYSFGDSPDWFTGLAPDASCTDPRKTIDVEINY